MTPFDAIAAAERSYASIPYTEQGENIQRFSDTVNAYGLAGCQGQPWCATYQFALELETVGKEQALANWCMSEQNYSGYSVFSTEAAFLRHGKTGHTPRVGALVIFKHSHMGRVLSISGDTFQCGEGNTSNAQYDRNGDACAVKTYNAADARIKSYCYIDYKDIKMDAKTLINAVGNVYQMAHNGHYKYGDSKTMPPCADGLISCDRLIARALYNLGYTTQPQGGITVLNMDTYLKRWGATVIKDANALKAGDIVLMRDSSTTPTPAWHTFILTAFTNQQLVSKYDMGRQERIDAAQPFVNVPLNQWPGSKWFHCAYRFGDVAPSGYTFTPSDVKQGTNSNSAYLATEILKARGYQGVKDSKGVLQDLELNFKWTKGDLAAMTRYKWDRIINGKNLSTGNGAGEINARDWTDLLGGGLPFTALILPDKQRKGTSVLLCQEILRARGIKGADGKPLNLDAEWGENTIHAVKQYQKARGLSVTGKVTVDVWRDMIGIA